MPILIFRGQYVNVGGSFWAIRFTCNDNQTFGKVKVRLVDAVFIASSVGVYQGIYRLDSVDGQMKNPSACSNYGGLLLNPFDAGQIFMRDVLQSEKSYEFITEFNVSTLTLQMTPAYLAPFTSTTFGISNFDSGFIVFEATPI